MKSKVKMIKNTNPKRPFFIVMNGNQRSIIFIKPEAGLVSLTSVAIVSILEVNHVTKGYTLGFH